MKLARLANIAVGALLLILASPLLAPQLLAFPYKAETEIGTVWSEQPIDQVALDRVAVRTQALLADSPIAEPYETRPIFLTDGGWRWTWLANTSHAGFALTRAVTRSVVVNSSDPASDLVRNGADIAGERSLSGVLAHEFTHGMLRRRYGLFSMAMQPQWKVEGYADHVAQESSLSAEEAARLESEGSRHPALPYFHGRTQVAERLAETDGSVDELFATTD